MQQKAGVAQEISPAIGLVASIFLILHIPYMQENLNKVWRAYGVQVSPVTGAPAPGQFTP